MKNKKYTIMFGIALVCVTLFTTCSNVSDTSEIHMPIKNGYGKISISFAGGEAAPKIARTVLPSTAFDKYVYTFTKAGETNGTEINPENDGAFIIEVGNYMVAVQAYLGAAEPYILAASGVSEQFNVGPNNNDPVLVSLSGVATGEEGEFSFTINYPANAVAEISLQKLPELDEITLAPVDVAGGNGKTQTLSLEAGSYLLTILVSKDELYAGITEAIHIYPYLSTVYPKDFTDDDLLAPTAVTLNSITDNSNETQTTTALTLTFSQVIDGLTADDITFDGVSGVTKGTLSGSGPVYTLPISGFTASGTLNVVVAKSRYTISGSSTVNIYTSPSVEIVIELMDMNEWVLTEQSAQVLSNVNRSFTVTGTYTIYRWYLDGVSVGTSSSYTFNKPAGVYQLVVVVTNNSGESRSGRCWVTVSDSLLVTVTFDANGGNGTTPTAQIVNTSSGTTLPSGSELSRSGYTFGGWNTNSSGTGTNYNADSFYTPTENITLYARWLQSYTVTFNANGGNGTTPAAQIVTAGSSIILPSASGLSKSGCIFIDWVPYYYNQDTHYVAGSSYTPTGNITLYARWSDGSEEEPHRLTINTWLHGDNYTNNGIVYYWFPVTSGTRYYVLWNDRSAGDGTKTLDVKVSINYLNIKYYDEHSNKYLFGYTPIGTDIDAGWDSVTFVANRTGTVYIKVAPYTYDDPIYTFLFGIDTGTFAITYTTSPIRP
jgi:uncharacterized repeat protein (TIGR02543 family)